MTAEQELVTLQWLNHPDPQCRPLDEQAMSKKISFKIITFFIAAVVSAQPIFAQNYRDNDWNVSLYANCGLPSAVEGERPIRRVEVDGDRMLAFRLHEGQVGTCSTDNIARHSAPFWERAEVRQRDHMSLGNAYSITFEAIFQEGFTGRQETFFQIHGWNGNCRAYPPVMMHFTGGRLIVWALRGVTPQAGRDGNNSSQGRHYAVQQRSVSIRDLIGKVANFEIRFDTRVDGQLSVYVNGSPMIENAAVEYAACAQPHVKLGVYRPGGSGSGTSAVIFDNINIDIIN